MFNRVFRCLVLLSLLTVWTPYIQAQYAPLTDCPDTQPFITGADVVCDQNSTLIYTYSTPPTSGTPTHSYQWTITPATGRDIIGVTNTNQLQVKWQTPGTYTVQVTEWNNDPNFAGCVGKIATKTISVQPLLHAYFYYEFDPTGGCFYNKVNFTGDVSVHADPTITYTWDFGDGTPVAPGAAVLTHTFPTTSGVTYTVTLTVTNSAGFTDQIIDYVYVNPDQYKPVANYTHSATPLPDNCLYNPMTFDASTTLPKPATNPENITILYYEWEFDDPGSGSSNYINSGTNPIVNHTFSTPGFHNVKLTVTNSKYCQNSYTKSIEINNTIPTASFTNSLACLGESTQFTSTSVTPMGTITELNYIFGDGVSYTSYDPTEIVSHTYGQLGSYTAKLRVKNSNNCVSEYFSKSVSVNPSPMASFLVGNACLGDAVQFTNTSTLNGGSQITAYLWNFDDPNSGSNSSTDPNPTHLFSAVGNYNVSLKATNSDGCANTYIISPALVVSPKPSVDFTYSNGTINWEILFHNITAATVGNNLVWDFGDGYFGYGPDPSHVYQGPGNFLVTLTATDAINGCSNSMQHQVTIMSNGSAFFTADTPKCLGDTMHFTPQIPGGNIIKEEWDFGDGTIVTYNPPLVFPIFATHRYLQAGTFAVTRTVTYITNFHESFSISVLVHPQPTANYTYSNNPVFPNSWACAHQAVYFTDLSYPASGNIIEWFWNFGDPASGVDNTSTLQNPQHIFTNANTKYAVTLTVTDNVNFCKNTKTDSVFVRPEVPVDFTFTNNTCLNQTVLFSANQSVMTPDSIATWDWDFGDGSIHMTSPLTSSHLYISAGNYTAILTVTDIHGCSNAVSKTVTVMPRPVAGFTFASPTCDYQAVQFTDQSIVPAGFPGFINKWVWYWGDGTSTQVDHPSSPNVTHIFPAGVYNFNVKLVVFSSFGCKDSIVHQVTLIPAPLASFEVEPGTATCATQIVQFHDLTQTNGGGSIVGWLWNFDDPISGTNNTSTSPNPTHIFNTPRIYNVILKVTNSNGCTHADTVPILIDSLPVANFGFNTACAGSVTSFTDQSTTSLGSLITSYSWNFGDGFTSTLQSPLHTYATFGVYNVTLSIVNSHGCMNSVTKQVQVNPKPVPSFTFSAAGCLGNPISFTDHSFIPSGFSGHLENWTWKWGDNTQSQFSYPNSPNTTHSYGGTATSYTVWLIVETSDGCIDSVSQTVTNIPSPLANFTHSSITCLGQVVNFSDLTQTNGGSSIQAWNWNFGDPPSGTNNTSALQNPSHSFTSAGTKYITLTVTSTNNCTSTKIDSITIDLLPVANFTYSSACEGNSTSFNGSSSVPNSSQMTSYSWNFGDGQTSTAQNPSHIYQTYGTFQVSLTVVNSNNCIHTVTKPVIVHPKPIADFSFSAGACMGSPISFTDQSYVPQGLSAQIKTWSWDFGDGTNSGTITFPAPPNQVHTYNGPGTSYVVRLTVGTFDSCFSFIEKTVTVVAKPVANFTHSSTVCKGEPVQFTDLSQTNGGGSIQTWLWNFGDPPSGANNTATIQNPLHTFTSATVLPTPPYNVILKVTNGNGCYDYDTVQVTVNPKPVANFVADTACLGSATQFNASSSTAVSGSIGSYNWDFGDGTFSSGNPTTHQYAAAGIYNVKLTINNTPALCSKDTIKPVLVLAKPVAAFSYSSPNCAGDSVQFTDLSSTPHGTIKTWKWNFGDGTPEVVRQFPANQNVKHKFTNGGNYNVTLTIITTDDCEASKVNTVIVGFHPVANFSFSTTVTCAKTPIQFTDLSQTNGGPAITSWQWNFGDPTSGVNNTSTTQNPLHEFSSGGNYIVRLIVTNANGCIDSVVGGKQVTVYPSALAQFSYDTACMASPTQFHDESTAPSGSTIVTWHWNFGDPGSGAMNISSLQNPPHTYNNPGTYTVILTVTTNHQCPKDTSMTVTVNPKPQANFEYDPSCIGDSTYFHDLSIAPGSSLQSWLWDFGDGGTSTIQNPGHTYTATGTYQVKLIVKNMDNCTDSVIIPVITRPKPVAAFTYASHFCPPGQVNFQDISTATGASIVDRTWIFPTQTIINNPAPVYTFANLNDSNAVTLIVSDTYGCMDTITDSVFVKPGFDFTFTNDTAICNGYAMHFYPQNNAQGDSLYTVSWNFGDPNSGSANTSSQYYPTHTFTGPGFYVVKFKAYNSDNCVDSVFRDVRVWALPKPAFHAESIPCDSAIYVTDSSTIVPSNGSIVNWIWRWGDGTQTVINTPPANTSHIYNSAQVYAITLVTTNVHGCVDSLTKNVQRLPCILAGYSYADTLCARYDIAFADTSKPVSRINQWTWDWDDGTPNTVLNSYTTPVYHTFANAGTYNVSLTIETSVNGATITDVRTAPVVIHPTPEAHFANPSVCLNQPTLFRDTSVTFGENNTKWLWTFTTNAVDTSTFKNPSFTFDTAGFYNVQMIVSNRFKCADTLEKNTRVWGLPSAHYDNFPPCTGDPTTFNDKSVPADTTLSQWHWNFGVTNSKLDTSDLQNPEYRYQAAGDYNIRMIVQDRNGCRDTIDSTLTVHVTPVSSFTLINNYNGKQGQVKLNNFSTGADDYTWVFGNGKTSNEKEPITQFTDDGTYSIMLITNTQFECSDTTIYEYSLLFKGLYVPNAFAPTSTNLGVRLFQPAGTNLKTYHIQVFDVWGHQVWESVKLDDHGAPAEGWDGTFEGNLLPQGNYMWKIKATFVDDSPWEGSDVGVSASSSTMGTVALIR